MPSSHHSRLSYTDLTVPYQDGCVKVVLHPKWYAADYSSMREGSMEREQASL